MTTPVQEIPEWKILVEGQLALNTYSELQLDTTKKTIYLNFLHDAV